VNYPKRTVNLIMILAFMFIFLAGSNNQAYASETEPGAPAAQADKKAILVVSFGTSYNDARVGNPEDALLGK